MEQALTCVDGSLLNREENNMKELVPVIEKPKLPEHWDYDKSVMKVKNFVYKWKNLTIEILEELYIAREMLSAQGRRTDLEK